MAFAHPGQHRRARRPASPSPFNGFEHDAAVVGHRVPRHDSLPGHLGHVHHGGHRYHVLRACHREQAVHQPGQPGQLFERAGQLVPGGLRVRIGVRGEQVEPQPERGQRGAQLVRHVRDHGPVPVHQGLKPPGHGVERRGQAAQLRRTGVDHGPDGQVAVGQPARGGVQPGQRPAHPPGQAEGQQGRADHGDRGDRAEDDPQPDDIAVQ